MLIASSLSFASKSDMKAYRVAAAKTQNFYVSGMMRWWKVEIHRWRIWICSYLHQQCWFYAPLGFKTFSNHFAFFMTAANAAWGSLHIFKLLVYHSNYGCTSFESNFTLNCIPLNPCRKRLCGSKCNFRKILVQDFLNFLKGFPYLPLLSERREIICELCKIIHRFGAWFNSVCN